ncbi:MAG: M16 family metallopeptidase [Bacteroidota bacterium]
MKYQILSTALFFILHTTAFAQTKLIEKATKKDNPFFIPYEKYMLENGLTVIVHEDHSDPVVHVDVTYHVGSNREEIGRSGFAHFYEHMMFQGSDHVGDEQHFKIVSAAGGTLNGTTNTDRTNYFETMPANQLEVALWLESDRMGFLLDAVTQKKFEIQRSTVKNERGQNYDNRPYGLVNEKIGRALYPYGHPYNWPTIGYLRDLDNATLDDLKQFFLRWYGPNNATLTVAGDVKTEDVLKLAEKYFGSIPRCPDIPQVDKTPVTLDKTRYISYEDNVRQHMISINYPTVPQNDKDEIALDALAEILSGNKNSPVYKKFIYNQKALNANCSHPTQELAGKFNFTGLALPGVPLSEMEMLFNDVLQEFKVNGITDDDLKSFKNKTEASILNSLSSVSGKASSLASAQVFAGNPNMLSEYYKELQKLKAADVMRVFEKYIYNQPAVILSVIPKNSVTGSTAAPDNFAMDSTIVYEKAYKADKTDLKYVKAKDNFDRSKQPQPGILSALKVPEYWTKTLGNELKLIGNYSEELPMVNIQLAIGAGHIFDSIQKAGLAYLTAEMFKESTVNHAGDILSQALSNMGSRIDVNAGANEIVFNISSLVKNLDSTLAIFKDMFFNPLMEMDEFSKVKNQALQTISNQGMQASTIANNTYNSLLYGNKHIFSTPIMGTSESVDRITVEDVRNYFQRNFSPNNSTLVVVGQIKQDEVLKKLNFLNEWKSKNLSFPKEPEIPAITKTKIYFYHKEKAPQSEIRVGYVALPFDAYGDFYNCQLMNFILGGTFNSRINLNLREDKGFTYGARSSFNGSKYKGPFTVSTGVKANTTDSSLVEIFNEIKKYKTKGITDEELNYTKNSISLSEALKYETNGQKAGFLKRIVEFNLEKDYLEKQKNILKSATKTFINATAAKYLTDDKMVIVVVGNRDVVLEPLKKLGYDIDEYNGQGTFVITHTKK